MEAEFLTKLNKHTEELRRANIKLKREKEKVINATVDTKLYCSTVGISRSTLTKRRDNGEISFVMLGDEYRYFLPEKGVSNA